MRNPDLVPWQMVITPHEKDLIRQLARREGKTMTRFVMRLVSEEADRHAASKRAEITLSSPPEADTRPLHGSTEACQASSSTLAIRLTPEQKEILLSLKGRSGRTMAAIVHRAIAEYVSVHANRQWPQRARKPRTPSLEPLPSRTPVDRDKLPPGALLVLQASERKRQAKCRDNKKQPKGDGVVLPSHYKA